MASSAEVERRCQTYSPKHLNRSLARPASGPGPNFVDTRKSAGADTFPGPRSPSPRSGRSVAKSSGPSTWPSSRNSADTASGVLWNAATSGRRRIRTTGNPAGNEAATIQKTDFRSAGIATPGFIFTNRTRSATGGSCCAARRTKRRNAFKGF